MLSLYQLEHGTNCTIMWMELGGRDDILSEKGKNNSQLNCKENKRKKSQTEKGNVPNNFHSLQEQDLYLNLSTFKVYCMFIIQYFQLHIFI